MKMNLTKILVTATVCVAIVGGIICISIKSNDKSSVDLNTSKSESKQSDDIEFAGRQFDDLGVSFTYPDKWKSKQESIDAYATEPEENINGQLIVSFIPDETMEKAKKLNKDSEKIPETDKEKIKEISTKIMNLTNEFKELCRVVTIDTSKKGGKAQKELFAKYTNKDSIGKEGNLEFFLLYNDKPNTSNVSEKSKKDYENVYSEISNFKNFVKVYKPVTEVEKLSENSKFTFKTKTLDNKNIDSTILKDNKLTMVNIWATYCGPCIEEMPELQELYEEVKKDDVNLIGLVSDTPDKDIEDLARQIVSKKGVKYTNLVPDKNVTNGLLTDVSGVPTTFFVDSEGNIIGDFIVGVLSKAEYKKEIDKRLQDLN